MHMPYDGCRNVIVEILMSFPRVAKKNYWQQRASIVCWLFYRAQRFIQMDNLILVMQTSSGGHAPAILGMNANESGCVHLNWKRGKLQLCM